MTHSIIDMSNLLLRTLPDASILTIDGHTVTIETNAIGKQIFDAERKLRKDTGIKYQLMCQRMQDKNKLRVKLARFRGKGDAV